MPQSILKASVEEYLLSQSATSPADLGNALADFVDTYLSNIILDDFSGTATHDISTDSNGVPLTTVIPANTTPRPHPIADFIAEQFRDDLIADLEANETLEEGSPTFPTADAAFSTDLEKVDFLLEKDGNTWYADGSAAVQTPLDLATVFGDNSGGATEASVAAAFATQIHETTMSTIFTATRVADAAEGSGYALTDVYTSNFKLP